MNKKLHFNRLIRDKVLDKLQAKNLEYKVKKLSEKDFLKELKAKISEEAEGVLAAKNKQEILKEMADLIFVIEEYKKALKISRKEFDQALQDNKNKKGGFKKRIYLFWTSDDGYQTNEKINKK